MLTSSPPTSAPGTDKTGMDFRRILPEIRCQSCLSPGSEPTPRGGFSNLLGWAFGPRNFMKNTGSLRRFPDVRGGFSPLSPVGRETCDNTPVSYTHLTL